MRRQLATAVFLALVAMPLMPILPAGAASDIVVIPGATYSGKGTKLMVDTTGKKVSVIALPVHPKCKNGRVPTNEGEYGSVGLGPFTVAKNGTFTNKPPKDVKFKNQTVITGKFSGTKVSGSVVEAAFKDSEKNFDCSSFTGTWSATRVKGTGDTTKPGQAYAKDDFSNPKSGFDTFNEAAVYGEYLKDNRYRIGTRQRTGEAVLRKAPVTSTADVSVTTGFTRGSGADGAGLACLATGNSTYVVGYVSLDGYAHLLHFEGGQVFERAPDKALPAGLLKTGDQAQNELRLICRPSPTDPTGTQVDLYLNGTKVAGAIASGNTPGKTGLFENSDTGNSEFTYSNYVVRHPKT